MEQPLLVRPTEAAKLLGIGRSKLYELLAAGELPVVRIGRSVRIPIEGLRVWVRQHTVESGSLSSDAPGSCS